MKTVICAVAFFLSILSFKAIAGDGYAISSTGISTILASPEVQKEASYFFIESIRQFGEIHPSEMSYILQFQRDDLHEDRFCLLVKIEDANGLRVSKVERWSHGSRLCHT